MIGLCSLLAACNNTEPEIQVETIISNITSEEFNSLGGTEEYGEFTQKDFKKLNFDFSMQHDEGTERKIEMFDYWRDSLNNYDGLERYWTGYRTSLDNPEENFAEYHYDLIFYSKGLSKQDIKGIFNESTLRVEWINNEVTQSKTYIIGDTITFKS